MVLKGGWENELCSGEKSSYVIFWGIVWSFKNNKNLICEKTCNKFVFLEARSSTCSWPMTFVGQEIPICLMRHNSHSPKILSCISKNVLIKKKFEKKSSSLYHACRSAVVLKGAFLVVDCGGLGGRVRGAMTAKWELKRKNAVPHLPTYIVAWERNSNICRVMYLLFHLFRYTYCRQKCDATSAFNQSVNIFFVL